MFCKRCGRETSGGAIFCDTCEKIVYGTKDTEAAAAKPAKQSAGTSANIYKFLCICMGLCLIAASVVWAAIFLRDRIDSPVKKDTGSPSLEALAEETAETEEKSKTTTTTTVTTTTTTTTTTDPYKQTVIPQEISNFGTLFTISDLTPVRIGPGYDYEKIERSEIPSGTGLEVTCERLDTKSGETWCYISYNDIQGWVALNMLSSKSPVVAAVLPDDYYYGSDRKTIRITRMGGLNLYAGPGESYDVIMKLSEDDTVTKEGYNYFSVKWSYVSVGDQFGWIKTYDGDWFNPTIE